MRCLPVVLFGRAQHALRYERALETMRQEKETLRQTMERESALKERALGQLAAQTVEAPRTPVERKKQINDQERVR